MLKTISLSPLSHEQLADTTSCVPQVMGTRCHQPPLSAGRMALSPAKPSDLRAVGWAAVINCSKLGKISGQITRTIDEKPVVYWPSHWPVLRFLKRQTIPIHPPAAADSKHKCSSNGRLAVPINYPSVLDFGAVIPPLLTHCGDWLVALQS